MESEIEISHVVVDFRDQASKKLGVPLLGSI